MSEMNRFLRLARISRRMTHQSLAEATGVTDRQIREMERGLANPSLALCRKVCLVLGRTLDDLFWREYDDSVFVPRSRAANPGSLKEARQAKRMSKTALAAAAGTTRQVITLMEKERYNPSLFLCLRLCWVLERTLDDLFWIP